MKLNKKQVIGFLLIGLVIGLIIGFVLGEYYIIKMEVKLGEVFLNKVEVNNVTIEFNQTAFEDRLINFANATYIPMLEKQKAENEQEVRSTATRENRVSEDLI